MKMSPMRPSIARLTFTLPAMRKLSITSSIRTACKRFVRTELMKGENKDESARCLAKDEVYIFRFLNEGAFLEAQVILKITRVGLPKLGAASSKWWLIS